MGRRGTETKQVGSRGLHATVLIVPASRDSRSNPRLQHLVCSAPPSPRGRPPLMVDALIPASN